MNLIPLNATHQLQTMCRFSSWIHRLLAGLAGFATLLGLQAQAEMIVYNNTSYSISKQINQRPSVTIAPGQSDTAPEDPGNSEYTLRIETTAGNSDYLCVVRIPRDGTARLKEEDRSAMDLPPNLYCETRKANGDLYDSSNYGVAMSRRSVRFFVSADCQFENGDANAWQRALAHKVNQNMLTRLNGASDVRGIILAGDLTQNARKDEFNSYKESFSDEDKLRWVFAGLGNHDLTLCDQGTNCCDSCDYCYNYCIDRGRIISHVRDQKRQTAKTYLRGTFPSPVSQESIPFLYPNNLPHYSWDWHDIHFVQLNLFPGDELGSDGGAHLLPFQSLSFLTNDLAKFVGNSGRPVVLIHHYNITSGWWSGEQKRKYWEAIKNYNVISILTGHAHPNWKGDWHEPWRRPDGVTGGPDYIHTFVTGAGRGGGHQSDPCREGDCFPFDNTEGAYVEVKIDDTTMTVKRLNSEGVGFSTFTNDDDKVIIGSTNICLPRLLPLYVDKDNNGIGSGFRATPYNKVAYALDAIACKTDSVDVRITAGNYTENLSLGRPMRLLSQGGTVRIGAQ